MRLLPLISFLALCAPAALAQQGLESDLELIYDNQFDGAEAAPWQLNDFGSGPVYRRMRVGGGVGDTFGPYYADNNHTEVTLNLAIIVFADETNLFGESLAGGRIEFRLWSNGWEIPRKSDVLFWFQAFDPSIDRWVNYINYAQSIGRCLGLDKPPAFKYGWDSIVTGPVWIDCSVDLSESPERPSWLCLGPNPQIPGKDRTYGCSPGGVSAALQLNVIDFGLVVVDTDDNHSQADPNWWKLYVDRIQVWLPLTWPLS